MQFVEAINSNDALRRKMPQFLSASQMAAMAVEHGFEVTVADLESAYVLENQNAELADEQLTAVSGGAASKIGVATPHTITLFRIPASPGPFAPIPHVCY
jgi:predicted ribosomally synthesized peptide with nif11-like leader